MGLTEDKIVAYIQKLAEAALVLNPALNVQRVIKQAKSTAAIKFHELGMISTMEYIDLTQYPTESMKEKLEKLEKTISDKLLTDPFLL